MKTHVRRFIVVILVSIALVMLGMPGCDRRHKLNLKSEYQAVFLSNGQAFIGKIEGAGTDYPLLTDVFYIESRVDPQTKQVTNVLVKRGKELHGPGFMYINARNILMIEPVAADSQVAKLIKEEKAKSPSTK